MISALTAGDNVEFFEVGVIVLALVGILARAAVYSGDVKLLVCLILGLVVTLIAQIIVMVTFVVLSLISKGIFFCYALCGAIGACSHHD